MNALMLRAIASWHLNKRDVALASARQAAEVGQYSYQAQYLYGWMLAQRNDNESAKNAIQVLRKALKLRPNDRNTLLLLLQCCQRINSDDTLIYLRKLPPIEQVKPEIQSILALYFLDRRDNINAQTSFLNAYRSCKRRGNYDPAVVLNVALFYDHHKNNRTEALNFYKFYLSITRNNPNLSTTRSQVEARIKQLQLGNNKSRNRRSRNRR